MLKILRHLMSRFGQAWLRRGKQCHRYLPWYSPDLFPLARWAQGARTGPRPLPFRLCRRLALSGQWSSATPANDCLCARCPFVENTASNIGGRALLFGQNQRVVGSDRLPDAWLRHVGTPSPRRAAPERCSTITIAPSKSILWILECGYSFKAIRRTKGIGLQAFL